tara:strand:- start:435 stop:548 length:114 start_codon:yes stop_codon:yes gene_type:complete
VEESLGTGELEEAEQEDFEAEELEVELHLQVDFVRAT